MVFSFVFPKGLVIIEFGGTYFRVQEESSVRRKLWTILRVIRKLGKLRFPMIRRVERATFNAIAIQKHSTTTLSSYPKSETREYSCGNWFDAVFFGFWEFINVAKIGVGVRSFPFCFHLFFLKSSHSWSRSSSHVFVIETIIMSGSASRFLHFVKAMKQCSRNKHPRQLRKQTETGQR